MKSLLILQLFLLTSQLASLADAKIDRDECRCGIAGPQRVQYIIIDGDTAPPEAYPWMALIEMPSNRICGGFLVSETLVVTAAHCFHSSDNLEGHKGTDQCYDRHDKILECYLHASDVTVAFMDEGNTLTEPQPVQHVSIHPKYRVGYNLNDIAVLQMKSPVSCKSYRKPICLPERRMYLAGRHGTVAGWGSNKLSAINSGTADMLQADVRIRDTDKCAEETNADLTNMLCFIGIQNQGVCYGDSGGPLMFQKGREYFAVGVVSGMVSKYCHTEEVQFGTEVSKYTDWIRGHEAT